jgi:glycosyltransferase involved in cell wall biosynthesis
LQKRLGNLYDKYSKYIKPLGYVDENDVNILYSNSLFFTFLSLYEGFGMPPLEAMQAGTPVICANNSSLPEVVGDAAILVNAEDENEIIEAYKTLYFDEEKRNEYIKKGLERAKLFSWDKSYKVVSDKIISTLFEEIDERA